MNTNTSQAQLVECVPNISEGRDASIIEEITRAVRETPGCTLLDVESDADHNRSVITFLGAPDAVANAAVRLAAGAASLIDLNRHTGEHPRMGAVDVIPLIPVRNITMDACVALSRQIGERVFAQTGIPVYLYEASATAPHRKDLSAIRKGQFEGMPEKMRAPDWAPDYGHAPHPTAGAVAIGARMPLIAFNINLSTPDLRIAKAIARIIRQSGGGLSHVKALGVMLADRNIAQVSINMTDFTRTPLYRVVELVRIEAARYGVTIAGTEIVGLTPAAALIDSAAYYLMLEGFDSSRQILENHLA